MTTQVYDTLVDTRLAGDAVQDASLRFYSLLAGFGPMNAMEFSSRAMVPRFFAEQWLRSQAAAGYLDRDPFTGRYAPWCQWPGYSAM
jgi:hypothetical protein